MDYLGILKKYYDENSELFNVLVTHSALVHKKAVEIAKNLPGIEVDFEFLKEASMIHDIGILNTTNSKIGCEGEFPYICHGYLGREIMEKEGYPRHALVCERHTGIGISLEDIEKQNLPLPKRDLRPQSIEEKIICLADKFYSKRPNSYKEEKPLGTILKSLRNHGEDKVERFYHLCKELNYDL